MSDSLNAVFASASFFTKTAVKKNTATKAAKKFIASGLSLSLIASLSFFSACFSLSSAASENTQTAQVTLVWNGIPQAHGYQLEEMAPGATVFTPVNVGTETLVTLSDRAYGEYRYRVIGCLAIPPATTLTCTEQFARYSDELVTQINAPQLERRVIFLHTDVLGSPAAETDVDGNLLNP